jgi:osmotically inducible lipoprotein OsmB
MRSFAKLAAAATIALAAGTASAYAACNGDTGTETVLGAASGAAVGGLASHSVAGAAIGGIAGGLIGNAIGSANNREDCRRDAYYYDRDRDYAYNTYDRAPDSWVDSYGNVHYYSYAYPDDE